MQRAPNFIALAPPLQPLRVPAGWSVVINNLIEVDPAQLKLDDPHWRLFSSEEDLLYVQSTYRSLALDVGWYGGVEGHFRLLMIQNDDWLKPLRDFSTRVLSELVQKAEEWLRRPPP